MLKILLLFVTLSFSLKTFSQQVYTLSDSASDDLKNYAILPDRGYSIDRVTKDTTLRFVINDSLRPLKESSYWIKIIISNPYSYRENYNIWLFPYLNNTLRNCRAGIRIFNCPGYAYQSASKRSESTGDRNPKTLVRCT